MIDSPLFGLLLLAVLAATPLVLRRMRAGVPAGIRVIGRTALHRNAVVAVVAVGERRLVLGAGERGVQLLTELEPEATRQPSSPESPASVSVDTSALDRTDAVVAVRGRDAAEDALEALLGPPGSAAVIPGPGIGLVDRLRAMTVRTPTPPRLPVPGGRGRSFHAPLRRS